MIGLADEVALGRYGDGGGGAPRGRAAGDAAAPAARSAATRPGATPPSGSTFAARSTTRYEGGRWIRSRRPELRTVIDEAGGPPSSTSCGDGPAATPDTLAGAERQEIEAVGDPGGGAVRHRSPGGDRAAVDAPRRRRAACGVVPRWSGEAALRVGGDADGLGDGFVTLAHAHYVAYSRPRGAGSPRLWTPRARLDYLAVPGGTAGG